MNKEIYKAFREKAREIVDKAIDCRIEKLKGIGEFVYPTWSLRATIAEFVAKAIAEAVPEKIYSITERDGRKFPSIKDDGHNAFYDKILKNLRKRK